MDDARRLPDDDDDGGPPFALPATPEEREREIRAALARSKADQDAGRTVDVDDVLARLRRRLAEYRAGRRDGAAHS